MSAQTEAASHPTWVRGLKCLVGVKFNNKRGVAPHVGAWIEIHFKTIENLKSTVAPHVGAWIEM